MSFYPNRRERQPQSREEWDPNSAIDYTTTAAMSSAPFPSQYTQNQPVNEDFWTTTQGTAEDQHAASRSMAWSTNPSRQAMIEPLQTPTQSTFFELNHPSGHSNATASMAWPSTLAESIHLNPYLASQQDQLMTAVQQQNLYTLPSFQSGLPSHPSYVWPLLQDNLSYMRSGELSPGHSDRSASSRASAVSSPPFSRRAERDWYLHDSPAIKVEARSEVVRRRLRSAPDDMLMSQHPHVNPNDLYQASVSSFEHQQSASSHSSPKHEPDYIDRKTSLDNAHRRPTIRRAVSLRDTRDDRPDKRGYTTKANSTCSCKLCGRFFQRSYNLRAHMETHNPDRDQPWRCQYEGCDRRFVRKTDLVRHWDSVHLKSRPYQCTLCSNSFARKDTLRRHIEDGCRSRPEGRQRDSSRRASNSSASSLGRQEYHRLQDLDTAPFPKIEPMDEE